MKIIRKRQLQFLGHVMRSEGMENLILTGKIEVRGSRERQRQMYTRRSNTDFNTVRRDSEMFALLRERDE